MAELRVLKEGLRVWKATPQELTEVPPVWAKQPEVIQLVQAVVPWVQVVCWDLAQAQLVLAVAGIVVALEAGWLDLVVVLMYQKVVGTAGSGIVVAGIVVVGTVAVAMDHLVLLAKLTVWLQVLVVGLLGLVVDWDLVASQWVLVEPQGQVAGQKVLVGCLEVLVELVVVLKVVVQVVDLLVLVDQHLAHLVPLVVVLVVRLWVLLLAVRLAEPLAVQVGLVVEPKVVDQVVPLVVARMVQAAHLVNLVVHWWIC